MFTRRYWLSFLALCELGCAARIDFTERDAGAAAGGLSALGGTSAGGVSSAAGGAVFYSGGATPLATTIGGPSEGLFGLGGALSDGGDSASSGGSSTVTTTPCDPSVEACNSPAVLVSNLMNSPCSIAADANYVYWTDNTAHELKKVPINGGVPSTLAKSEGDLCRLVVDSKYAYWVDAKIGKHELRKLSLNDGAITTLATGFEISYFAVGAGTIVFTSCIGCVYSSTGHVGYNLINVPIEDGAPTVLYSAFSEEAYPTGVTINDTNVYWSHGRFPPNICQYYGVSPESPLGGTILKLPLDGGTPTPLASAGRQPFGIFADDTNVYWADCIANDCLTISMMSVPIAGGTPKTLVASEVPPSGIAAEGGYIYWTRNGTIMRVPRGGGAQEALVTMQYLGAFAVDATNLYWVDLGDGTSGAASLKKLRLH